MSIARDNAAEAGSDDRHRYPGVRSFQERDVPRFFGRRRATEELLLRVLSVKLLLQFAPSGAGKTSLLNAGLFPRLRPHGYLPVSVRLNQAGETLVQSVTRSLKDAADRGNIKDPVIPDDADSVWALLDGAQLWSDELLLLTPVLVFDQFEEVFTLRDATFRNAFAREIGELTRGRSAHAAVDNAPAELAPNVKVIISLREEYLGALEEMTAAIPDLFRERLRLVPLTNDEAREAIVEPARLDGNWASPPFSFEPDCLESVIDFVDGASPRIRVVEPLTLQLVCQRAESIAATRPSGTTLVFEDFGGLAGLERLVHTYYGSVLSALPDKTTRKRATAMFEHGLLDPSGKRLMLEQDEIHRQYDLDEPVLASLVESRLLRREPRNESIFYEISHDRLTEVIARNRSTRLPAWVRPTLGAAAVLIVGLGLALSYVLGLKRETTRAQQSTLQALDALFGDSLILNLREAGLSHALERFVQEAPRGSDALTTARRLRRQGELAWERATLAEADASFSEALEVIDDAVRGGRFDAALQIERAQILKALGDVSSDRGEVSAARDRYAEAVATWNATASRERDPHSTLNGVELEIALASARARLGDALEAESGYVTATGQALEVVKTAYLDHESQQNREGAFLFGRSMQIYVDAVLSLGRLSWDPQELKSARALAAESLRRRPLSAQARIALGTASATYANAILQGQEIEAIRLYEESASQFRELTEFDPLNRRMLRDRAAVQLLSAHGIGTCAFREDCRKRLRAEELVSAESAAFDATGKLADLSHADPDSQSLRNDVAWGKETQARLHQARGRTDEALVLIDDALKIRRSSIADAGDNDSLWSITDLLDFKTQALTGSGRNAEGLEAVEERLLAVEQLPAEFARKSGRIMALRSKAQLLTTLGNPQAARLASDEAEALEKTQEVSAASRREQALALNEEANGLYVAATHAQGYDLATEKYRAALLVSPGDPVIWSNLRGSCAQSANTQSADAEAADAEAADTKAADTQSTSGPEAATASAARDEALRNRETQLRCAFEGSWMAWLLSDDDKEKGNRSRLAKVVYTDRRALARMLNEIGRDEEALVLAEHGVKEAETIFEMDQSDDTLFLLADSYFGLGLTRLASQREGWEQALRVAITRGEQHRDRNPGAFDRWKWVHDVRSELAGQLEAHALPVAARERQLANISCQDAYQRAKKPEERETLPSCQASPPATVTASDL